MKTRKNRNYRFIKMTSLAALLILGLFACKKDKSNTTVLHGSANVMAVHAAPDATAATFYLDETKITNNALSYGQNSTYVSTTSGKRSASFKGGEGNTSLVNSDVTLEDKKNYSIFFIGTVAAPEVLTLEDDLATPAAGKARVRFVNLSPDNTKVDVRLKSVNGNKLATGRDYKSASNFIDVDPGSLTYEVLNSADESVLFTMPAFSIQEGKIYTIWIKGSANGTGNSALGANLIEHNK